jgi:hypothetical protein
MGNIFHPQGYPTSLELQVNNLDLLDDNQLNGVEKIQPFDDFESKQVTTLLMFMLN